MKLARIIAVVSLIVLLIAFCSNIAHGTISAGEFVWSIVLIVAFANFLIKEER